MLVLSRKEDESLRALMPDGTEIRILVAKLQGNSVTLGIEAPTNVIILRDKTVRKQ